MPGAIRSTPPFVPRSASKTSSDSAARATNGGSSSMPSDGATAAAAPRTVAPLRPRRSRTAALADAGAVARLPPTRLRPAARSLLLAACSAFPRLAYAGGCHVAGRSFVDVSRSFAGIGRSVACTGRCFDGTAHPFACDGPSFACAGACGPPSDPRPPLPLPPPLLPPPPRRLLPILELGAKAAALHATDAAPTRVSHACSAPHPSGVHSSTCEAASGPLVLTRGVPPPQASGRAPNAWRPLPLQTSGRAPSICRRTCGRGTADQHCWCGGV
eukprot:351737-Chlamydomonas_euryale.AAC.13